MAKIIDTTSYDSTWAVTSDVEAIVEAIASAGAAGPRSIFFVGETHNFDFDKKRNGLLVAKLKARKDVITVVERAMFSNGEVNSAIHKSVITEAATLEQLKSSAPERNVEVVKQLVKYIGLLGVKERLHPVVIVFGQIHEAPIKAAIESQLPVDDRIHWVSFKSVDDQLTAMPSRYDNVPGDFELLGYIASEDRAKLPLEMRLFEKGYVPKPFYVKIYAPFLLAMAGKGNPLAVHSNDAVILAKRDGDLYTKGSCMLTINDERKVRGEPSTFAEATDGY